MNIIGNRKRYFIISGVIVLIGLLSLIIFGLNQDIDFVGGTSIHINMGQEFDNEELAEVAEEALGFDVSSIQKVGENGREVIIQMQALEQEQRDAVWQSIQEKYGLSEEALLSSDNINPTIGKELKQQAFLATLVASILMLVYISFRFDFKSGLAAVVALLHDVFIMITVYSLFRVPVNSNFIAAILTILGYSINATIVIFDRIRENRKYYKKEDLDKLMNRSILENLSRSINTSLTTLITITALYVLGVESIKNFSFPLIIGILAGTYSSVFISASVWYVLEEFADKRRAKLRYKKA